jgi:hypothetical protein
MQRGLFQNKLVLLVRGVHVLFAAYAWPIGLDSSLFAMQPFEPSEGCLALRKLMANGCWMADKYVGSRKLESRRN